MGSEVGIAGALVPLTYMDAFPLPGRAAGSLFTTTDDERGMIWESSLNSMWHCQGLSDASDRKRRLTLLGCRIEYMEVKIVRLTHVVGKNYFTLQIEDRYTSSIE